MPSIYHPRASFWAQFATAALGSGASYNSTETAAEIADKMMAEFDKRFEWYSGGYGEYWTARRPPEPPPNATVKR